LVGIAGALDQWGRGAVRGRTEQHVAGVDDLVVGGEAQVWQRAGEVRPAGRERLTIVLPRADGRDGHGAVPQQTLDEPCAAVATGAEDADAQLFGWCPVEAAHREASWSANSCTSTALCACSRF